MTAQIHDPILARFRAAVAQAYGERLDRAVLFGSRARGDHRPDSDYDIAVFIRNPGSLWDELGVLVAITSKILIDTGAEISAKPFAAESHSDPGLFMSGLRREGVEV